jgi:hypothetical protein
VALTDLQRRICRLIADARTLRESYVAGGVALNSILDAKRVSSDIDLFHDSEEALQSAWEDDRRLLLESGYAVNVVRERAGFVEADVSDSTESVIIQWARDSAFRFFPLASDPQLGLTMHPFDLATNKVLALIGRAEPRDWVDIIRCHESVQEFGLMVWAACGKDPGFSPSAIVEHASRTGRYSAEELGALDFEGERPDAAALARTWHGMLSEAKQTIERLPGEKAGTCVLTAEGTLFRGGPDAVTSALRDGQIRFHAGRLRGAYPSLTR